MKKNRRVVITGLGIVSSIGIGINDFWPNLLKGKSGISKVTSFDTSKYERHYAGEVKNFDPTKFMNKRKVEMIGRSSQMAIAASKLAFKDAKLKLDEKIRKRFSVFIGMTMAEMGILEAYNDVKITKNKDALMKKLFAEFPANSIGSNISLEFKLNGYNTVFSNACASGNYSIGNAYDLIRNGKTDYALAGGSDRFSRVVFTGFARLFAMAPEKCCPFDMNRKGMMVGEGAGVLLLETLENAKKRKADIYAEVLGYGLSCDAHHMTNPSTEGIATAYKNSLIDAGLKPEDIDYISAHGTGTPENDKSECTAIKTALGKRANQIPISSIKSMLGHTMGAASAIEAIACCLAIKNNEVPPTINYETPDPECDIDCVPNLARKQEVNVALNNSSAFGGNNCCLAFYKV